MLTCNFCGKNYEVSEDYRQVRSIKLKYNKHIKHCSSKLDMIYGYSHCRFCNEECSDDYVYVHEQQCSKIKEFSPYFIEYDYYKDLLNYDINDKKSESSCRFCNKTYKSCNIFKHESNCTKQFNMLIGPQYERKRCVYCRKMFYSTSISTYREINMKTTEIKNIGLDEHIDKCRDSHFRVMDGNRKIIKLVIRNDKKYTNKEEI
jgi:hypothetical protein